jgi:hypothetical protein
MPLLKSEYEAITKAVGLSLGKERPRVDNRLDARVKRAGTIAERFDASEKSFLGIGKRATEGKELAVNTSRALRGSRSSAPPPATTLSRWPKDTNLPLAPNRQAAFHPCCHQSGHDHRSGLGGRTDPGRPRRVRTHRAGIALFAA